ncbi:MAG: DUF1289 domain-containing protein [Betaproteobacteria bacterium]|nr:DUF1289 domain-containing protein [Betaproteobacteria bacterium]
MKSPCNKVCVMDANIRYCRGCRRTLDEIARWGEMSDAEHEAVLAALPARASEIAEGSVPPLA